jgi:IclR family transcriptional regulator, acetate operon repressor
MKLNQSVHRAAAILRAAAAGPTGDTASGLARAAGLPTSTALRLIHTLETEGFLARRRDGRFAIGLGLARLGREAEREDLVDAATRAALDRLAAETRETVTLSVVRGRGALEVVLQVDTPHTVKAVSWVGRRYPLHASSSGKVLLASLEPARLERFLGGTLERPTAATITNRVLLRSEIERVRAQGYAVMVDELEDGLASVSVPIREGGGELAATLNVTGPSFRFDAEHRTAALALMLAAASQIEGTLPEDLERSGLTQASQL